MSKYHKRKKSIKHMKHRLVQAQKLDSYLNQANTRYKQLNHAISILDSFTDYMNIIQQEINLVNTLNLKQYEYKPTFKRLIYYKPVKERRLRKRKLYTDLAYEPVPTKEYEHIQLKNSALHDYFINEYDYEPSQSPMNWTDEQLELLKIRIGVEFEDKYLSMSKQTKQFYANLDEALKYSSVGEYDVKVEFTRLLQHAMNNTNSAAFAIQHVIAQMTAGFTKVFYDSDQMKRIGAINNLGGKVFDEEPDEELFQL